MFRWMRLQEELLQWEPLLCPSCIRNQVILMQRLMRNLQHFLNKEWTRMLMLMPEFPLNAYAKLTALFEQRMDSYANADIAFKQGQNDVTMLTPSVQVPSLLRIAVDGLSRAEATHQELPK